MKYPKIKEGCDTRLQVHTSHKGESNMKVIKPSKEEVWESLKANGCCWLGGNGKCKCYSRSLSECFKAEEKRLTRTEYTAEEIKQKQEQNTKEYCYEKNL